MIVAIEGMDGVGKTTVARRIEKDLHYKYVKDPLKELLELDEEKLRKLSDKIFCFNDSRIKAWYLALGDIYTLSYHANENMVLDRHVLLNYFWNGNQESEEIFRTQINVFGKPDLTILLYANSEVRMKRISKRNPMDPDLYKENMKAYGYDKLVSFLQAYQYRYVVVDTEKKSIQEVVEECKKIVREFIP